MKTLEYNQEEMEEFDLFLGDWMEVLTVEVCHLEASGGSEKELCDLYWSMEQ